MGKPGERKLQILQTLAGMLEVPKGEKITTAALAARLDCSEAALYRHFASKAQMYAIIDTCICGKMCALALCSVLSRSNSQVLWVKREPAGEEPASSWRRLFTPLP